MFLRLLLTSAAASALLQRYGSQYSLGIAWNFVLLFFNLFIVNSIWTIIVYPRFFSPLRHLPMAPGRKLITGHTKRVIKDPSGQPQREWVQSVPNDGLIRYNLWLQDRVLLTTPKNLAEVLVEKNYIFVKPHQFRNGLGRILGIGILLAEGDEHKVQRKNLMPAFAFRHIKDLYPSFWAKSREMTECLAAASKSTKAPSDKIDNSNFDEEKAPEDIPQHAPGVIEVGNFTSRATLDIIGLSGMGHDFNSLQDQDNQLNKTYRTLFNEGRAGRLMQLIGVFLPFWFVSRLPVKRNADVNGASAYIKDLCRKLIAEKRMKMAEKEKREVDIISVALESGGFTDEELVNQMMTFLVAGHETTATAMVWANYLLCKNPGIQEKLRNEVRSQLPSPDQNVTSAEVENCQYLRAVCNEVLRLYPPVTLTIRQAACDTTINGQFIPKDTIVILPPWAINTSTELWGPDAAEFKPERWLDADGKANNKGGAESNFAFLTFLHGPRSCIGQKFAQAEFECLLAAWVGRFKTTFEEGSPLAGDGDFEMKGGITNKPKGGLWVNLEEVGGW